MCPTDPSAYFWNVAASSHRIGSPSQRRRSRPPARVRRPRGSSGKWCARTDGRGLREPRALSDGRTGSAGVSEVDTAPRTSRPNGSGRQIRAPRPLHGLLHPRLPSGRVPAVADLDPDLALRQEAITRARQLIQAYDDLVPINRLREGFQFQGQRISFGSFQKGIHRSQAQQGPAALTLTTSFKDPYADAFDESGASFTYAYRRGAIDQADNRALRSAYELQTPLGYSRALGPGLYWVVAPMLVTADDPATRTVVLQQGLPEQDMHPGGFVSSPDLRAYATREARYR